MVDRQTSVPAVECSQEVEAAFQCRQLGRTVGRTVGRTAGKAVGKAVGRQSVGRQTAVCLL